MSNLKIFTKTNIAHSKKNQKSHVGIASDLL